MKVALNRVGFHDYETDIYHMMKLFYEEVEWVGSDAEPEFTVTLTLEEAAEGVEAAKTAEAVKDANVINANGSAAVDNHTSSEDCTDMTAEADTLASSIAAGEPAHAKHAAVTAALRDAAGALLAEASASRKLDAPAGTEAYRRELKRVVGAALLQALQQATGIEQPWGILTGVRPMKLLHNMMQQQPMEECRRVLREEYLLSESKVQLLSDIGERQLKVIPDLFHLDREVSIYIGIPFCPTKCAYCTFPAYDIRGLNGSVEAFLEGLHEEIRATGAWLKQSGLGLTTLYWGGGTPTSIEAHQMDALFETLHEAMPGMASLRELTVEAGRPDTITKDKIDVMKRWKVDRISINPQSFTQATLDTIGRHHTVRETIEKFLLCRELGMNNINMDLIIGLPQEGMKELELSLRETEKLMPESLTVHTLSFKRASRMTQNRDSYEVAERDEVQEMMRCATDWTAAHGYNPYYMYRQKNILGNQENVGYALGGFESLYNIVMMEERQTVIGLGCGAVSKIVLPDGTIERFPNPKEPSVYNQAHREYTEKKLTMLNRLLP